MYYLFNLIIHYLGMIFLFYLSKSKLKLTVVILFSSVDELLHMNSLKSDILKIQQLCFNLSPLNIVPRISSLLNIILLRYSTQCLRGWVISSNFIALWIHIWHMKLIQINCLSPETISISSVIYLRSRTNVELSNYMSTIRAYYFHVAWR